MSDNPPPLSDLYGDATPPSHLKARVERTLRSSRMIGSAPRGGGWARRALAASLIVVAVGLGYVTGVARATPVDLAGTYVLLLYEDSTYSDPRPEGEIVAEYRAWADSLANVGALVLAERLDDQRIHVAAGGITTGAGDSHAGPTGMFVVRAPDAQSATAIASGSPHVRQGGRVVVRAIPASSTRPAR
jgi:hypothetical protein